MMPQTGLFRSAALYTAANAVSGAIPFLLLPVLTRVLSPVDFGIVAMFSTVQMLLAPLIGLSMKSAVTARFFHGGAGGLTPFVTTCLLLVPITVLLTGLAIWPARHVVAALTQVPAGWLLVAVLGAAAQFIVSVQLALWQARRMAARFSALLVLQSATNVGLSLLLVLGVGLAWEGRVLGQTAALVIFATVALLALRSARDLGWPPRLEHAREALAFSLPLVPHGLGSAVTAVADRVLITNLLNVEQTGLYMAAMQISMVLGLIADAFNRAYAPWLFAGLKQDTPGFRERVVRGAYLYCLAAAGFALVLGLAAPLIVRLVLGESFHASAAFIPYLAVGFVFGGMYLVAADLILYSRRTSRLALATVLSGIANILLSFTLISYNGAVGAAQAFMLSQAILFLTTWRLAQGALPMPWWPLRANTRAN